MELTLTRRGDYVLRAAIALGRASPTGELRKVREVAAEMQLPRPFAAQILNVLVKAGIAESKAGSRGGYWLLRPPAQISLLEIVEAAEGQLWPVKCVLSGGPCHWDEVCAIHPAWEDAYRALTDALRRQTLASILIVDKRLEAGLDVGPLRPHEAGSGLRALHDD